jgi:8-oxo-dGTP pyrophosphatase MutT (NUDIX family)
VTLHAEALRLLAGWRAPDAEQEALRRRYVAHLEAQSDAVFRSCRPDHLTAGALVVSADHRQVLLTLHAKAGRWFQLGGHCEPGDSSLADAALREATEESGVDGLVLDPDPVHLDEHAVTFCGEAGVVHHLDVRFVAVAAADAVPVVSAESTDVHWWPVDGLPEPDTGLVARAVERLTQLAQSTSDSWPGGASTLAAEDQPSR